MPPAHVGGVSGEGDLDGDEWIVSECGHGDQVAWDPAPCLGLGSCPEAPGHLELDLCHADLPLPGVIPPTRLFRNRSAACGFPGALRM